MAAPPPPTPLPAEMLREVLIRLPPDEPEHLVRAASVCWCGHVTIADPEFRIDYHRFHGALPPLPLPPPVLGFADDDGGALPLPLLGLPDDGALPPPLRGLPDGCY
jgi:hypothetical protein